MAYTALTNANLKIYGVSTRSLKDFLSSERDVLRGVTRIPTSDYRMWKENMVEEEKDEQSSKDFDNFDDEDFENQFVIIEKIDLKKYNQTAKLQEEQKIIEGGNS